MLIDKQRGIKYHFFYILVWRQLALKPGPLANTLKYDPFQGVEHSGERINGCHLRNAKLFLWIEQPGIQ